MTISDLTDVNKRKATSQLKKPSRRPKKKPRTESAQSQSHAPTESANNAPNPTQSNPQIDESVKVASHYNQLTEQSRSERQNSQIFHLRSFNNWCKSVLILKYVRGGDSVLDFCCGKGGDLMKYSHANIKEWHGVDIAKDSVEQALQRYNRMDTTFGASFYYGDLTKVDFNAQMPQDVQFDATSCQFALHYSWISEEAARNFLRNATAKLKPNGHFVCTTTDGYVLKHKLMASKDNTIKNSIMEARFDKKDHPQSEGYYGIRYVFSLAERVDSVPEYLVHPKELVRLADEFGLDVVENLNFHHFYQKYATQYSELTNRFKIMDSQMGEDEWDTIYLYRVFVFRKRANIGGDSGTGGMQNAYFPSAQSDVSGVGRGQQVIRLE